MSRAFLPLAILPTLALAACGSDQGYPSLTKRPAERISGSAPCVAGNGAAVLPPSAPVIPPPAEQLGPPNAELTARLGQLVDQAQAADRRFSDRRSAADRAIAAASGSAVASENWSVADIALADLESARNEATIPLAELDQLYAAERIAHYRVESPSAAAIAAAREQVLEIVGRQDAVLLQLRKRMRV
jgi:hypothetical protein